MRCGVVSHWLLKDCLTQMYHLEIEITNLYHVFPSQRVNINFLVDLQIQNSCEFVIFDLLTSIIIYIKHVKKQVQFETCMYYITKNKKYANQQSLMNKQWREVCGGPILDTRMEELSYNIAYELLSIALNCVACLAIDPPGPLYRAITERLKIYGEAFVTPVDLYTLQGKSLPLPQKYSTTTIGQMAINLIIRETWNCSCDTCLIKKKKWCDQSQQRSLLSLEWMHQSDFLCKVYQSRCWCGSLWDLRITQDWHIYTLYSWHC